MLLAVVMVVFVVGVWSPSAPVRASSGIFTDSGQRLGNFDSRQVALGDLDSDGDLDAFVANAYSTISLVNKVWLNDGNGIFSDSGQSLGGGRSVDVALGDLDGDGDLDALVGNGGINFAWLNDGGGTFSAHCQWIGGGLSSYGVALVDLNGAGGLDIFMANASTGANQVWFRTGVSGDPGVDADCVGMFIDSDQRLGGSDSRAVVLGDMDLDAFIANDTNQPNKVWLNDGIGMFSDSGQTLGNLTTKDIALGDVDGDGDLDAFAANTAYNEVWLNDGAGNFADSGQTLGNAGSHGVALGDLDGDGDIDAFVANYNNSANTVWLNSNGFLEGMVDLQGRSDESGAEVCAWQGGVEVVCKTTDAAGNYSFTLSEGTCDVTVEMARYLDAEKFGVTVVFGQTATLCRVILLCGDVNDDDVINILDLSFIGYRFGWCEGDPGWDPRADCNNDGCINILDITGVGVNFNKTSPVLWLCP